MTRQGAAGYTIWAIFYLPLFFFLSGCDSNTTHPPRLDWPVEAPRITQDYASYNCGEVGKFHTGIDLTSALFAPGSTETPVMAAHDGVIELASASCPTAPDPTCGGGLGNYVVVRDDGGYASLYAHLGSVEVRAGNPVARGERIGIMGTSGNSRGTHLHFDLLTFVPHSQEEIGPRYTTLHPNLVGHRDPKEFIRQHAITVDAGSPQIYERPVGASFPSPDQIATGKEGQRFVAVATYANCWHYVFLPSRLGPVASPSSSQAVYGWLKGSDPGPSAIIEVEGQNLNGGSIPVRSGAGSSYSELTRAWGGQRYVAGESAQEVGDQGCSGGLWFRVDLPANADAPHGWICGDFLQAR